MSRIKLSDVQTALTETLRSEVSAAAGDDGKVQPRERRQLGELALASARALGRTTHSVDAIVDHAVARAADTWAEHNQASGSGRGYLSRAELSAIDTAAPEVGRATRAAIAQMSGPAAAEVSLGQAPVGVSLSEAQGLWTVRFGAEVPVGSTAVLSIGTTPIELKRGPQAIEAAFGAPEGYGLEVVSRTFGTGDIEAVLKISKDASTDLKMPVALEKARTGLAKYIKSTRMKEPDWKAYFASSWTQLLQAGVMNGIQGFADPASPETQIDRRTDRYVFVGRGPFNLYTEVEVAKRGGKVLRAFVEID